MIKWIIFISTLVLVNGASKYYAGENRPYEFGFNIEGNQHRHEKKDENGIIMGEFGFITADNVYHVTVYATDADGHFKILSMKNIKLMSEPMAKNVAGAIESMKSQLASSSPQPRALFMDDTTTTPQPFVIHSTAAPVKEVEVVAIEPTTQRASDIKSCSNCKIPEPPKQVNIPYPQNPPQMPSFSNRFRPQGSQGSQGPRQGTTNLNLINENSFGGASGPESNQDVGEEPSQPINQNPNQEGFPENTGNQELPGDVSSGLENVPIAPSMDLQPPEGTSLPAKEDYAADQRVAPEGRSLDDDQMMSLTANAVPEDLPIESVMARFKGVEVPRKQPDVEQNFVPQPRVQSPEIRDNIPVEHEDRSMEQMLQGLLYLFNYTAGYHGHHEKGDREGNKEGEYYFVGRDGLRRSTEYRADARGYQPKFKLERVPEEETPREETEKEAGLKGNEFKWFYL